MKGTIELQRELEKVQKQIAVDKYISDVRKAIEQGRFESTAEAQFIIKSVLPTYSAYIREYLNESYRGEKEKDKNKKPVELGSADDFMLTQAVAFINGQPVKRSSSKLE